MTTGNDHDTDRHTTPPTSSATGPTSAADTTHIFVTDFTALNNSGVQGAAVVTLNGNTATVDIDATGLEPGQIHPQHIHGLPDGADSHSPTLAQDADHDGFVELAEGQKTYGPILLNLDNNPGDLGANPTQFPTADADGHIRYHQTFTFDPNSSSAADILHSIMPLDHREIVLHGESVAAGSGTSTSGEVDGSAGYKPVLPVASGELHEVSGSTALAALSNFQLFDQSLASAGSASSSGTMGGNAATSGNGAMDNSGMTGGTSQAADTGPQTFVTDFSALNNSGVHGGAMVTLDGNTATVDIAATGLEPGQVHPQHIHGLSNGADSHSPTIAQDADHDGFVELAEGQATYGPILLNLNNNPGDLGANPTQFPTADADGNLVYHQTFTFDPNNSSATDVLHSIMPLDHREIVLHGESVAAGTGAGTSGEVDGSAGYKAVLPVASGELHQVSGIGALAALSNLQEFEQSLMGDSAHQTAAHHDDLNAFALGHA